MTIIQKQNCTDSFCFHGILDGRFPTVDVIKEFQWTVKSKMPNSKCVMHMWKSQWWVLFCCVKHWVFKIFCYHWKQRAPHSHAFFVVDEPVSWKFVVLWHASSNSIMASTSRTKCSANVSSSGSLFLMISEASSTGTFAKRLTSTSIYDPVSVSHTPSSSPVVLNIIFFSIM
jgi:hypothetical protein